MLVYTGGISVGRFYRLAHCYATHIADAMFSWWMYVPNSMKHLTLNRSIQDPRKTNNVSDPNIEKRTHQALGVTYKLGTYLNIVLIQSCFVWVNQYMRHIQYQGETGPPLPPFPLLPWY